MPKANSKITDSFELHLPKEVRSLNKTLKDHWSVRAKDKGDWAILLMSELNKAKRRNYPLLPGIKYMEWLNLKKHITITRVMRSSQHEFDHDNLVGGCKQLVDAMKGILIKDDTAEYVAVDYRQVKGKRGGTIIKVSFGRGR